MKNSKNTGKSNHQAFIRQIDRKLATVMPDVHKQVKIYEERLRDGRLKPIPVSNPLFSE